MGIIRDKSKVKLSHHGHSWFAFVDGVDEKYPCGSIVRFYVCDASASRTEEEMHDIFFQKLANGAYVVQTEGGKKQLIQDGDGNYKLVSTEGKESENMVNTEGKKVADEERKPAHREVFLEDVLGEENARMIRLLYDREHRENGGQIQTYDFLKENEERDDYEVREFVRDNFYEQNAWADIFNKETLERLWYRERGGYLFAWAYGTLWYLKGSGILASYNVFKLGNEIAIKDVGEWTAYNFVDEIWYPSVCLGDWGEEALPIENVVRRIKQHIDYEVRNFGFGHLRNKNKLWVFAGLEEFMKEGTFLFMSKNNDLARYNVYTELLEVFDRKNPDTVDESRYLSAENLVKWATRETV